MTESSKKGTKRGKKAKLAMEAAMRSTSHALPRISEPDSDDIAHVGMHDTSDLPLGHGSQSEGLHSPSTPGSFIKSRNTRGLSLCKGMSLGYEERTYVQFNALGHPFGDGSIKLSTYCGILVRDIVPIIYDDWRKVPEEIKKNLWILIKQKFNLDDEYQRKYVLGAMGSQLREYRLTLSRHIRKASKHDKPNMDSLKPTGVDDAHWDMFAKKRLSGEFKEKIKEFTTSQQSSTASGMKDDAVSHIFGPEHPDRVRGVGFGVTPSQLSVSLSSSSLVATLEAENAELKKELAELQEQMGTMMAWMSKLYGGAFPTQDSTQQTTGLQTPVSIATQKTFKRDEHVKLLDLHGSSTIVAIGRWMSNDPTTTVHNVPLGEGGSHVAVLEAIVPGTPLWKDNNDDVENPTLEDVVGSIIAWPTACIIHF